MRMKFDLDLRGVVHWLLTKVIGPDLAVAIPPNSDSHPRLFTPSPTPTVAKICPPIAPPAPVPSFSSPATSSTVSSAHPLSASPSGCPREDWTAPDPSSHPIVYSLIGMFIFTVIMFNFRVKGVHRSVVVGDGAIIDGEHAYHDQGTQTNGPVPDGDERNGIDRSSCDTIWGFSGITSVSTIPTDPYAAIPDNNVTIFEFSAVSSVEIAPVDEASDFAPTVSSVPPLSVDSTPSDTNGDEQLELQARQAHKVISFKAQDFLERYTKLRKHFSEVFVPDLTEVAIQQAETLTAGVKNKRNKQRNQIRDYGAKMHKICQVLGDQDDRPSCNSWCDRCGLGMKFPDGSVAEYRCEPCAIKQAQRNADEERAKQRQENKAKAEAQLAAAADKKSKARQA